MEMTKTILSSGFNPPKEWMDKIINEGVKVKDILYREPKVEGISSIEKNRVIFTEDENSFIKWVKYLHKD